MRVADDKSKQAPLAGEPGAEDGPRFEGVNPRARATKEAVEKDGRSADAVVKPGVPPDPGMEEDYGARAGEIPSQEPGNPKKDDIPEST